MMNHQHHSPLTFRPSTPSDLPWLLDLRLATMHEHHRAAGNDLSVEDHRSRVLYDFDCIRIILLDGEQVGMIKVKRGADEWKLSQIQILPEHQGKGIGGQILDDLLDEARKQRKAIVLSALKNNPARKLYERTGFEVVEERGKVVVMRTIE